MYPKKFHKIAHGLPNKTRAECVLHYYRSKKKMKYKERREAQRKLRNNKKKIRPTIKVSQAPRRFPSNDRSAGRCWEADRRGGQQGSATWN